MSKYDNASLVQIPSGYKAGTLYSVLPANGDGDFDFTRASIATRVNSEGLIETVASGVPRLDYPILNGVVQSCPALLLEPARTNLVKSSGDISTQSTYWSSNQSGTSIQNAAIAPDGTNTASQITSVGSAFSGVNQSSIVVSNVPYTYSCYLKAVSGNPVIRLTFFDGVTFHQGNFTITSEWERYSFTFTPLAGTFAVFNTCTVAQSWLAWGAQLELGSYATSYIPTSGSSVTRAAETCNNAGNTQVINSTEGVLYTEISALADDLTFRLISLSDGTTNNRLSLGYRTTSNAIYCEIRNATVTQAFLLGTVDDINNYSKVAVKYKQDDFALWINGIEVSTDNSGLTPLNLSQLNLDSGQKNGSFFYGRIKSVQVYNQALTDSQLAALTS